MASRRRFLAGLASLSAAPSLAWSAVGNPVAVSAALARDGSFKLLGLTETGQIAFEVPLPARGHAAAAHPHKAEVVAIARRPGTFAKVIDCANGSLRQTIAAPEAHHFYGHAAFSQDGRLLFTTENHIASGDGRIGVWDRADAYKRIGEFASAGVGPHEIQTLPSGDLAVANGGIQTHPKTGREKLNLANMQANLSVFSTTGALLDRADVPARIHQNSLRHIAAAQDGTIVCGFQWQGDPFETPPLVMLYTGQGKLAPTTFEEGTLRGLDGYIGSVCTLGRSGFAASAPRGGRVLTFDAQGAHIANHHAMDICGVARLTSKGSLATDGNGNVFDLTEHALTRTTRHDVAFDNHLVALV